MIAMMIYPVSPAKKSSFMNTLIQKILPLFNTNLAIGWMKNIGRLLFVLLLIFATHCQDSNDTSTLPSAPSSHFLSIPPPKGYPITIQDDRGKAILIPKQPQRIVLAGTGFYWEILSDLAAQNRVVAVTDAAPKTAQHLPKIGTLFQPNIEHIVAYRPDVVLGTYGATRDQLESLGLCVLTLGQPGGYLSSIPEVFQAIRDLDAMLYGNWDRANTKIAQISEQIITLETKTLERSHITVAIVYVVSTDRPVFAVGRACLEHELLYRAGGTNVFADLQGGQEVSLEQLLARSPQVLITDPQYMPVLYQHPLLQNLDAIKNKHVLAIPSDQWLSSVATTVEQIANYLEKVK